MDEIEATLGLLYLLQQAGVSVKGKPLELEMNFATLDSFQREPLPDKEIHLLI